jgi:hypothetical protein
MQSGNVQLPEIQVVLTVREARLLLNLLDDTKEKRSTTLNVFRNFLFEAIRKIHAETL